MENNTGRSSLPKIALVIAQLTHGGAEKQLVLLARGLKETGEFEPVVLCTSSSTEPHGSSLSASGVAWRSPGVETRRGIPRLIWLLRQLHHERCDLIYGVLNTGNIYGGVAAWLLGLPFIASIRNADPGLRLATRTLSGLLCRRARMVVANSASCVTSLRRDLGVTHQQVCIIPNALDISEPASGARLRLLHEWGIPLDACVVGTVANLKAQKRAEFFLRMAVHCLHSGVPAYFVWVGDGPERSSIERALAQMPSNLAERIRFPGARRDIADCLAAFDLFVLTSAYEGLPSALLEAMAAGLPCVATDVPGTRDILGSSSGAPMGLLADPDAPQQFARTLTGLLRDSDRMRRLGQCARKHVHEHYTSQAMVEAFTKVFRSALHGFSAKGEKSSESTSL